MDPDDGDCGSGVNSAGDAPVAKGPVAGEPGAGERAGDGPAEGNPRADDNPRTDDNKRRRAPWAATVRATTTAVRKRVAAHGVNVFDAVAHGLDAPRRWPASVRLSVREHAQRRSATRAAAEARRQADRHATEARQEALRRESLRQEALRREVHRREAVRRDYRRLVARERARRTRRRRLLVAVLLAPLLAATGLAAVGYYVDTIPTPAELELPESTTVYFADGVTPMARLGMENRTILGFDEMNDAVKQAIVAAEDRSFWTNPGVDFASVLRAAWNNATGGPIQGGSTITQQYTRVAADLRGLTYARKAREAILAWKVDREYSKEKILEFYLNTIPFGRGAYGIEAAAQAFFGKTAQRGAPVERQVTVAEAMVLAALVKQPEPDPDDPSGLPGYDPVRGGLAAANALSRWEYVREGMISLGYLSTGEAGALQYPHTVLALDEGTEPDVMSGPSGLVVNQVLSELRISQPFAGKPPDFVRSGGFRIVTTIDRRAQDVAEAAADIRRATVPKVVRGQPANWQAALVAVEPGTGRVLAYYGGGDGTGADHAGWFIGDDGDARGYGQHPPGSSFKVYVLAEALRQGISIWSRWDSPAQKEFPSSGRTQGSPPGPVRNSGTHPCQPQCTLWQAVVASLNVPFFDLTERLGTGRVIDMARRAGIDSMWTDRGGGPQPVRMDLRGTAGEELAARSVSGPHAGRFSTEVGIGQYGITVLDHANGMATFAAGGKRAQAHFVREVSKQGVRVYAEALTQSDIGLSEKQMDELTWALSQVPSARLADGWDTAGKTGTWQAGTSTTRNAHTWMVGYTRTLATAVWLGTTDGKALVTKDGHYQVYGSTHAGPIWQQFMTQATKAMRLYPSEFRVPDSLPSPAPVSTPTSGPR